MIVYFSGSKESSKKEEKERLQSFAHMLTSSNESLH